MRWLSPRCQLLGLSQMWRQVLLEVFVIISKCFKTCPPGTYMDALAGFPATQSKWPILCLQLQINLGTLEITHNICELEVSMNVSLLRPTNNPGTLRIHRPGSSGHLVYQHLSLWLSQRRGSHLLLEPRWLHPGGCLAARVQHILLNRWSYCSEAKRSPSHSFTFVSPIIWVWY